MAGPSNGLEELEQDLGKLSLDSSSSQMNYLVVELEKLVVEASPPLEENKPPGQEKKEVSCRQVQKAVLEKLLAILKSPDTPDRRQQIVHFLKNFPALMALFIKERQKYQQIQAALVKQCQTYQKVLAWQMSVQSRGRVSSQRLPDNREIPVRTFVPRPGDRGPHAVHGPKNKQQLLAAVLRLQQKLRQVQVQRNNPTAPLTPQHPLAVQQFVRAFPPAKPATLRPHLLQKFLAMNHPDLLILYRPYHAAAAAAAAASGSASGNVRARKQLLPHRLQVGKPLQVSKLRTEPVLFKYRHPALINYRDSIRGPIAKPQVMHPPAVGSMYYAPGKIQLESEETEVTAQKLS